VFSEANAEFFLSTLAHMLSEDFLQR
jgi:hypothetical protein